jgi:hypothetical protein
MRTQNTSELEPPNPGVFVLLFSPKQLDQSQQIWATIRLCKAAKHKLQMSAPILTCLVGRLYEI